MCQTILIHVQSKTMFRVSNKLNIHEIWNKYSNKIRSVEPGITNKYWIFLKSINEIKSSNEGL